MQSLPNDVYRTPMQNETPANSTAEGVSFDTFDTLRQSKISEAKADLERFYFAKAALAEGDKVQSGVWQAASVVKAERQSNYVNEIFPYIKHVGEFINFERDEVINRGWSI